MIFLSVFYYLAFFIGRYIRLEAADPNFVAGLTERDLVKMNERLIKYQHLYSRTSVQFDELVQVKT